MPEMLVLLIVLTAMAQVRFGLTHRWLGLEAADPSTNPARVLPPEGLQLPSLTVAPAVAQASAPGRLRAGAVAAAVAPYVRDKRLGQHLSLAVAELDTGRVVYRRGSGSAVPASTMKLLTSAAALESLGPMTRFRTSVRLVGGSAKQVVLVGGGDPFLMSSAEAATDLYPRRASLDRLANRTAAALKQQGIGQVRVGYDDSLFTGPAVSIDWPLSYLPEFVVPPISALWVDEARGSRLRFTANPSRAAADVFRAALVRHGIEVRQPPVHRLAGPAAPELAAVQSAPVGEIVQHTLAVSDNLAAEVLSRHVGLAELHDGSFSGGAAAVEKVLRSLAVPMQGSQIYDGSGLSRKDRLDPATLLGVLRVAASPDHPELREVLTGLPVAGFTGSLQWRFGSAPVPALGRVRAKTGTLTGVHGLAGVATDAAGNGLLFVAIADRVALADNTAAQMLIDRIAAALGSCRC